MPNYNRAQIMGHLTRDPESKSLASGVNVTECGIATTEKWKDKNSGETKEKTAFVDFVVWGRRGELFAEWFNKGSAVFIEGSLELDQWDDKETGKKRSKLKIKVSNFENVGGRSDTPYSQPAAQEPASTDSQTKTANANGEWVAPGAPDDEGPF